MRILAGLAVIACGGFVAGGVATAAPAPHHARETSNTHVPVPIPPAPRATRGARTLLVGTYHGLKGQYRDLQSAINAAKPGDWILVAPGDYREKANQAIPGALGDDRSGSEFLIRTPDLHIRGMDRNTVWLDGTQSGPLCSSKKADQDFGPGGAGRDGIVVYKVSGVTIENLSDCNDLSGSSGGDEIWWDGGASSGKHTAMTFRGDYLTATSTYWAGADAPSAAYGIYSSNTMVGPGVFVNDYGSNMSDSGFYVGACPDCGVILDDDLGQDNAEGYSGTNSGNIVIEDSVWDYNRDGFDTNSQNDDDAPSPQSGQCLNDAVNPAPPAAVQSTHSCWVFEDNLVYDNNNANVPVSGVEYDLVTGTGFSIYGGRYNVVTNNRFIDNGAWGVLLAPYPDTETPPPNVGPACVGGTYASLDGNDVCYYDDYGNEIANNTFTHDGYYGNDGNADIGDISGDTPNSSTDGNCFHDNVDTGGTLTSQPANVDNDDQCGSDYNGQTLAGPVGLQLACGSRIFGSCPSGLGANYPYTTTVNMSLPKAQPTMPHPCSGVPGNAWCPSRSHPVACAIASGKLTGTGLGPLALGTTRSQARQLFVRWSTRGLRSMDFYCLTPIGIRAGYPSPSLLSTLSAHERTEVRGRVILALTANPHYSLDGVRPGTSLVSAEVRLRLGPGYEIGPNRWYVTPNGPSDGVLKVRNGIVEEIGIANKSLTLTPAETVRFLSSFG